MSASPPGPPAAVGTLLPPGAGARLPHRGGPLTGWPLRRTLVASILVLFVVVTLTTGLASALVLQRSLETDLDERVVATAQRVLLDHSGGGPRGPRARDEPGRPPGLGGDFLLLRVPTGATAPSENIVFTRDGTATQLNAQQVTALADADLSGRPRTLDLGGTLGRYRLVGARVGGEVVVTGLPTARLDAGLRTVRLVVLVVGAASVLVLAVSTTWLVRRALRPLTRVAQTATRVSTLPLSSGEVALAERVPWADTDRRTEIGQVGAAVNDLLDHVDAALSARHDSETQLRRFVADASHELRTPLASIRGYAELSTREREPVPEGVTHALTRIGAEAERMATLVDDLLLLARLDAGRPLERADVDLSMLVIDTLSDARVAGPDHQWRLEAPEDPVEVVGDPARLAQVLLNLLTNARIHTPAGTTVTARLRRAGGVVLVEVEDDGPGIDPAVLPTVFHRFSRGDAARTRAQGSTGLGLSIVQAVAAAHGGSIGVTSRPGRTVFTLRLPSGRPPDPAGAP